MFAFSFVVVLFLLKSSVDFWWKVILIRPNAGTGILARNRRSICPIVRTILRGEKPFKKLQKTKTQKQEAQNVIVIASRAPLILQAPPAHSPYPLLLCPGKTNFPRSPVGRYNELVLSTDGTVEHAAGTIVLWPIDTIDSVECTGSRSQSPMEGTMALVQRGTVGLLCAVEHCEGARYFDG